MPAKKGGRRTVSRPTGAPPPRTAHTAAGFSHNTPPSGHYHTSGTPSASPRALAHALDTLIVLAAVAALCAAIVLGGILADAIPGWAFVVGIAAAGVWGATALVRS